MEITLVTNKPATSPDTQEPLSDSHEDLSAPTLTSLKFIFAGIFASKRLVLALKFHEESEYSETEKEVPEGVSGFQIIEVHI